MQLFCTGRLAVFVCGDGRLMASGIDSTDELLDLPRQSVSFVEKLAVGVSPSLDESFHATGSIRGVGLAAFLRVACIFRGVRV